MSEPMSTASKDDAFATVYRITKVLSSWQQRFSGGRAGWQNWIMIAFQDENVYQSLVRVNRCTSWERVGGIVHHYWWAWLESNKWARQRFVCVKSYQLKRCHPLNWRQGIDWMQPGGTIQLLAITIPLIWMLKIGKITMDLQITGDSPKDLITVELIASSTWANIILIISPLWNAILLCFQSISNYALLSRQFRSLIIRHLLSYMFAYSIYIASCFIGG